MPRGFYRGFQRREFAMGACFSAPGRPAADDASVSSARTFGVTPLLTVRSDDDTAISGETVELPLDSRPSPRTSGTQNGFGSFLRAKMRPVGQAASHDDAAARPVADFQKNLAQKDGENATRVMDQPAVRDAGAAATASLAGKKTVIDKSIKDVPATASNKPLDTDGCDLATHADTAYADKHTAAREEDVDLALSEDGSHIEVGSQGEDDSEVSGDESRDDASHDVSYVSDVELHEAPVQPYVLLDTVTPQTDPNNAASPVPAPPESPAPEPAAPTTPSAEIAAPGTPGRDRDGDEDDSLSMIDMGPVSDSEADSEADGGGDDDDGNDDDGDDDDGDDDGDESAPVELEAPLDDAPAVSAPVQPEAPSTPEAKTGPESSSCDDAGADASDATLERSFDDAAEESTEELPTETEEASLQSTEGADENKDENENKDESKDQDETPNHDDERAGSSDYESSAYSDEDDVFDAEDVCGPKVASTVESSGTTVDATVTEVLARSKHSPPPTPRVRGAADWEGGSFSSRDPTPRSGLGSARSNARSSARSYDANDPDSSNARDLLDSSRAGGVSYRSNPGSDKDGWQSVVVLYVTSVAAVKKTVGQCQRVRQTLANLGVEFLERDVSMATSYKDELKRRMTKGGKEKKKGREDTEKEQGKDKRGDTDTDTAGTGGASDEKNKLSSSKKPPAAANDPCLVPCLFVDDECVGLGESLDEAAADGSLGTVLEDKVRLGRAKSLADNACAACASQKLVTCDKCDGSMRWRMVDPKTGAAAERRCPWCNEVGMQVCSLCASSVAKSGESRRKR